MAWSSALAVPLPSAVVLRVRISQAAIAPIVAWLVPVYTLSVPAPQTLVPAVLTARLIVKYHHTGGSRARAIMPSIIAKSSRLFNYAWILKIERESFRKNKKQQLNLGKLNWTR